MRCVDCLPLIEEYFDGEVEERTAEQMSAHLSACEDCSAALDALSFEQEVYARYDRGLEVTPALWARVSAEMAREPTPEARDDQRPFLSGARRRLAGVLSSLAARPALASSFALLLVGVAIGSLWFAQVRRETPRVVASNETPTTHAPAAPNSQNSAGGANVDEPEGPAPTGAAAEVAANSNPPREFIREGADTPTREMIATPRPPRRDPSPEEDINSLLNPPPAQTDAGLVRIRYDGHETRPEDSPAFVKMGGGDAAVVQTSAQLLDPEQKEVARHVEQAQMLLRSIKNARPAEGDTFNVAYERKLSRRLLGENSTLQLDAETRGDKETKQVLDRIEPYLLDIANMHDNASREEVRSVKERIDSKEIIAALQVY